MDAVLIYRILKSIKTGLYVTGISILVFLAGSVYIPNNLDIFSEINDFPLFHWLTDNNAHIGKTYWIYCQVVLMAALALNMVICTIDELIQRLTAHNLVLKLSPHILHAGVILVLFGHLVSGGFGYKKDIPARAGETIVVEDMQVDIKKVDLVQKEGEDQRRWNVKISIVDGTHTITKITGPASPVFINGIGIFAKSAEESGKVLLGIVRDPGVKWEIGGAIIFMIGSLGIFWSRYIKI